MRKLTIYCIFLAFVLAGCEGVRSQRAKHYRSIPEESVVIAIIGEAEGEDFRGKVAVGCGIINRIETLQGVWGARSPGYRLASKKSISEALKAWEIAKNRPDICYNLIQGADMWENVESFGQPSWPGVAMVKTKKVGNHTFYRRLKQNN